MLQGNESSRPLAFISLWNFTTGLRRPSNRNEIDICGPWQVYFDNSALEAF